MAKAVWEKARPKKLGKAKPLSPAQKASAKASAKSAGRPYPNLVDNMKASRRKFADGGVVNIAEPPAGMTNLTGSAPAATPALSNSPYTQPSAYGTLTDQPQAQTGLGLGQQAGPLIAKDRVSGSMKTTQGYAKGGLVKVRGAGKARSKPCKVR